MSNALGGYDHDKFYDTILQYDPDSDSWEVVGHMMERRDSHAVMVMDSGDFSDYCNLTTTALPTTMPPTTTVPSTSTIPPSTTTSPTITIPQTTTIPKTTTMSPTTNMPPTTTSNSITGEIALTIP